MNPDPSKAKSTAAQDISASCDNVSIHSNNTETDCDNVTSESEGGPVNNEVMPSVCADSSSTKALFQVKTRFGIFVKSVNRFIQNMTQNIKTTSPVSEFAKSLLS